MSLSAGPKWPFRFLRPGRPWSRRALALSAGLHAVVVALAGWATRGGYNEAVLPPAVHTSRAYAIHYLVLTRPETRPQPRPERALANRPLPANPELVIPVSLVASPPSLTSDAESRTEPLPSSLGAQELSPGEVSGVGQVIATAASVSSGGGGLLGTLGFRVPGPDEVGPPTRGLDRVAELVTGSGSACPELRPPAAWANRAMAVAVAFVVDTGGVVDQSTLRVVESPGRPQTEQLFHSHIYVVGAAVRPDRARVDPAGYDSVVTHEVSSHVAGLVFRPALREGRAVRSTVLISCQTSPPG